MSEKKVTTMRDSNGDDIPLKYVSKFDRARDAVCRRIHKRFFDERARLEQLVKCCIADLDALMKLKESVGLKGNFQTSSFDGNIQVSIDQQYNIQLDERVVKARELMMEYVNEELNKAGGAKLVIVRKLIEGAFRANSRGFLPVSKILELMRMEVPDKRWNEARGILQDAIKPVPGKRYLNCRVRASRQHDFETIRLDLATCWPDESVCDASHAEARSRGEEKEKKGGE